MMKRSASGLVTLLLIAGTMVVALGWNRPSPAQIMSAGKGGYAEFEPLIGKHGDKGMLLEVHMLMGTKGEVGEVFGKVVQATNEFLILKAQDGQALHFVTWDDVIWITARPN